jgi:hypothetical protein
MYRSASLPCARGESQAGEGRRARQAPAPTEAGGARAGGPRQRAPRGARPGAHREAVRHDLGPGQRRLRQRGPAERHVVLLLAAAQPAARRLVHRAGVAVDQALEHLVRVHGAQVAARVCVLLQLLAHLCGEVGLGLVAQQLARLVVVHQRRLHLGLEPARGGEVGGWEGEEGGRRQVGGGWPGASWSAPRRRRRARRPAAGRQVPGAGAGAAPHLPSAMCWPPVVRRQRHLLSRLSHVTPRKRERVVSTTPGMDSLMGAPPALTCAGAAWRGGGARGRAQAGRGRAAPAPAAAAPGGQLGGGRAAGRRPGARSWGSWGGWGGWGGWGDRARALTELSTSMSCCLSCSGMTEGPTYTGELPSASTSPSPRLSCASAAPRSTMASLYALGAAGARRRRVSSGGGWCEAAGGEGGRGPAGGVVGGEGAEPPARWLPASGALLQRRRAAARAPGGVLLVDVAAQAQLLALDGDARAPLLDVPVPLDAPVLGQVRAALVACSIAAVRARALRVAVDRRGAGWVSVSPDHLHVLAAVCDLHPAAVGWAAGGRDLPGGTDTMADDEVDAGARRAPAGGARVGPGCAALSARGAAGRAPGEPAAATRHRQLPSRRQRNVFAVGEALWRYAASMPAAMVGARQAVAADPGRAKRAARGARTPPADPRAARLARSGGAS